MSTFTVHDNQQLMAVGFSDGTLLLFRLSVKIHFYPVITWTIFRGDIARERGSKQKLFKELNNEITGLAFKVSANRSFLFVSTYKDVVVYNISQKDKEQKVGCGDYINFY